MPYLTSLKNALANCDLAEAEAEALLSSSIKREHEQLYSYTKQSWEALMMRHPHDRAIEALAIIAEFRTKCAALERRIQADHR